MPRLAASASLRAGLVSAAILSAAPLRSLAAQAAAPVDPVLQRIWAIGMDSSHVERLAFALLDSVGPRLTGTPLQKQGNDWLVKTYASWGIGAANEKVGTWRGWRRGHSHIDLVEPRLRSLSGMMLGYSPGTAKKDLVAPTIILPRFADSAEFVRWLPSAKGKLVLVNAALPSCRPRAEWERFATAESRERMDSARAQLAREWAGANVRGTGYSLALGTGSLGLRMEQAGIAGMITSSPTDAPGTVRVFETYNTKAPAVALTCEDYGLVYRLTERGAAPRLRLDLDAQLLGETPIFNTIATVKGSEKPDEYVMLSAHFDSWDGSSGASDNGTGTIAMMEAMRILRQVYPSPKRTLLVGHWTAEEQGLIGSRAYSEDHPEVVAGLQALFNQDNGTGRIQRVSGSGLTTAAQHMTGWLARLPEPFRSQLQFDGPGTPGTGGSDHASFACHGAPAFGLGALDWNYSTYTWHTNVDTYDKVVFDDLKSNATVIAMLAYLASEDPQTVGRERVDLAALAAAQAAARAQNPGAQRPGAGGRGGRGGAAPREWPACTKAARSTNPRLR